MIKVINLFGAPGCGKSTTAAGLFWRMKCANMSVELVSEYAKECVFENRMNLILEDQLYIFTQQHRKLFRIKDTYEYAIMDSPLILSSVYRRPDSFYDKLEFDQLLFSTHYKYDNINFFIYLENQNSYEKRGRIHEYHESIQKENEIYQLLTEQKIKVNFCSREESVDKIYKFITEDQKC